MILTASALVVVFHLLTTTKISFSQPAVNPQVCNLPQTIGTGPYRIPRWYYNPRTQKCELFYYSGCCGNENNFRTPESCQVLCEVDPCTQGMDQGTGNLQIPRYYFNRELRICEQYVYFGSGGNRNNFASVEACQQSCREDPNPCAIGSPLGPCNSVNRFCSTGSYCHIGATDNTTTCCRSQEREQCSQPLETGIGNWRLLRWYFDMNQCQCRQFTYRGLRGNQNNFLTQQECETTCSVFCNVCSAGRPALQPNGRPLQCSTFSQICSSGYYCHVGENADTTICCPATGNECNQPRTEGEGNAIISRYYFDPLSRQCNMFTYRGRRGNQNNFLTLEACTTLCRPFQNPCTTGPPLSDANRQPMRCSQDNPLNSCPSGAWCHVGETNETTVCCTGAGNLCNLPMQSGQGQASLPRWYFDGRIGRCSQFIYSGLGGNQNNFQSNEMCLAACRQVDNPCLGEPARQPNGQVIFCSRSNKDNCPVNYWCHIGFVPETTLCCAGPTNPCSVPLAPGTGTSRQDRWYYNALTRICTAFPYSGKGGNQNNFISRQECDAACPDGAVNI